ENHTCRVFAVPAEKNAPLFTPVPHNWVGFRIAGQTPIPPLFLDEGRGLLTVHRAEASWRDPRTGRGLRVLPFSAPGRGRNLNAIALSGDGNHLLLAGGLLGNLHVSIYPGDPHVLIYDVASAQPVSLSLEHRALQPVFSAAFSPDGKTLLTGSSDHTARR